MKPKKLSCGNGPDLVFILFSPRDDARIGETDDATSFTSADFLAFGPKLKPEIGSDFEGVSIGNGA